LLPAASSPHLCADVTSKRGGVLLFFIIVTVVESVDDRRLALSSWRVGIGDPVDNCESHGEDLGIEVLIGGILHRYPQLSTGLLGRTSSRRAPTERSVWCWSWWTRRVSFSAG